MAQDLHRNIQTPQGGGGGGGQGRLCVLGQDLSWYQIVLQPASKPHHPFLLCCDVQLQSEMMFFLDAHVSSYSAYASGLDGGIVGLATLPETLAAQRRPFTACGGGQAHLSGLCYFARNVVARSSLHIGPEALGHAVLL